MNTNWHFHVAHSQSLVETQYNGENCWQSTVAVDDDTGGRWGDTPQTPRKRAQVASKLRHNNGDYAEYAYSLCFPSDYVFEGKATVMSLHENNKTNPDRPAPLFDIIQDGSTLRFIIRPDNTSFIVLLEKEIVPDMWYHFNHVHKYTNTNKGYCHVSCNGQEIISYNNAPTMDALDTDVYIKLGLYVWGGFPAGINSRRMYFKA